MAGFTGAPGPSDISSWQSQIIRPGAVVNGNTAATTGVATANPMAINLYNMTDDERKQIALTLKNAGYNVPTTGIFSDSLLNAFTTATAAAQSQAMQLGQPFDQTYFTNYLARETAAGGMGAGGKTVSAVVSSPTSAKQIINLVFRDQLGREASDAEVKKYTKALNAAQKQNPQVTVSGGGDTTTYTGLNEQQYLMDQISGTDEAKRQKVMGFYDTFKRALGVA